MVELARKLLAVVLLCSAFTKTQCWCTDKYLVTCERLSDIKFDGNEKWENLIIGDISNQTSRVPNETVTTDTFNSCRNLEEVTIIGTISSMDDGAFAVLKQLAVLKLYHNVLKELPSLTFLSNLVKLDLRHNEIESVGMSNFDFTSLKAINLSFNKFRELRWRAFNVKGLRSLSLAHNELSELTSRDIFSPDLLYLNMSHNKLYRIEQDCFRSLDRLEQLDLSHNQFSALWVKYQFQSLQVLDFSHNMISLIEPGVFEGMPNLATLKLDHNLIQQLPVGMFGSGGELKLVTLQLHNNRMEDLQFLLEDPVLVFQEISIAENPWPCDCLDLVLRSIRSKGVNLTACDYEFFRSGLFPVCIDINSTSSLGACAPTHLTPDVYDSFLSLPKIYRC